MPCYSPAGDEIVVTKFGDGQVNLMIMKSDGTHAPDDWNWIFFADHPPGAF
jgi:hypothetical protein